MSKPDKKVPRESINVFFEHNQFLPLLYGERDMHLDRVATALNVEVTARGNMLSITGHKRDIEATEQILESIYAQIKNGVEVTETDFDAAIRMMPPVNEKKPKNRHGIEEADTDVYIRTMRKTITPYSHVQANYIRALYDNELVFALGPAGTGKTYIAVAMAVEALKGGRIRRI